MKEAVFQGAATAIVTPFRMGKVDFESFGKLLDFQAEGGVSAIVVCGTTGEGATLTESEKLALYEFSVQRCRGRMKVICGIGNNDTAKALDLALKAKALGADAVMLVTPYYNKSTQEGLVRHFFHVADGADIPLIVYNVPSRTGIGIQPETYARLCEHPNINGVKEASGNIAEFGRSKALCGEKMHFWSGNDSDTVAMMALGAKGVISVASNLLPDAVSRLCQLCLAGDFAAASALNERFADIFSKLFIEVNPIPVKHALHYLGLCGSELRLPLCGMDEASLAALIKSIENLSIL